MYYVDISTRFVYFIRSKIMSKSIQWELHFLNVFCVSKYFFLNRTSVLLLIKGRFYYIYIYRIDRKLNEPLWL